MTSEVMILDHIGKNLEKAVGVMLLPRGDVVACYYVEGEQKPIVMDYYEKLQDWFDFYRDTYFHDGVPYKDMVAIKEEYALMGDIIAPDEDERTYLEHGDTVYCNGCYLTWNKEKQAFMFGGVEDDTFFHGKQVEFDSNGDPFIIGTTQKEEEDD